MPNNIINGELEVHSKGTSGHLALRPTQDGVYVVFDATSDPMLANGAGFIHNDDLGAVISFLQTVRAKHNPDAPPPVASEAVKNLPAPPVGLPGAVRVDIGIETPQAVCDFLGALIDHQLIPTFIGDPAMLGAAIYAESEFEAGKLAGEYESQLNLKIKRAPQ